MIIQRIKGWTREIGKSQGFIGLPLRDATINTTNLGQQPCMVTAWEPTPDELEAIANGGLVYLTILGTAHPPVLLTAHDPTEAPASRIGEGR